MKNLNDTIVKTVKFALLNIMEEYRFTSRAKFDVKNIQWQLSKIFNFDIKIVMVDEYNLDIDFYAGKEINLRLQIDPSPISIEDKE